MSDCDEHPTENNPNINNVCETRIKRCRITMEIPMLVTMLTMSLTGKQMRYKIYFRIKIMKCLN